MVENGSNHLPKVGFRGVSGNPFHLSASSIYHLVFYVKLLVTLQLR